ncbi:TetR family transcriptional regulator [Actinopolymorpha sp. B11F2]|uniref:acyl-CoA-like ligand-binding transcription factor n=1 Tax=Actinopolymorpha sp. B11F2 TaxID=3160862 RepID=UPI0032E3E50C
MSTDPLQAANLRERKKLATRAAISEAALRLAIERGPENVLIQDIADAAGVAPRTVNNYFPSKEAAIIAEGADRAAAVQAAIRTRQPDEPLWTALRHALQHALTGPIFGHGEPDRAWVAKARLVKTTPELQVEQQKSDVGIAAMLTEEIARRTGTDPQRDLYPRLAAAACISTVRAAIDHWLDADPATPLDLMVSQALQQLAAGLPAPNERPGL